MESLIEERDYAAKTLKKMNSHMHKIDKKVDNMEKELIKILKKKVKRD